MRNVYRKFSRKYKKNSASQKTIFFYKLADVGEKLVWGSTHVHIQQ